MTSRISQQDHESNNQEASSSVSASMRPQHEEKASEANTNDSSASITAASHHDASSNAPTSDPSSSEYPEPYSKSPEDHSSSNHPSRNQNNPNGSNMDPQLYDQLDLNEELDASMLFEEPPRSPKPSSEDRRRRSPLQSSTSHLPSHPPSASPYYPPPPSYASHHPYLSSRDAGSSGSISSHYRRASPPSASSSKHDSGRYPPSSYPPSASPKDRGYYPPPPPPGYSSYYGYHPEQWEGYYAQPPPGPFPEEDGIPVPPSSKKTRREHDLDVSRTPEKLPSRSPFQSPDASSKKAFFRRSPPPFQPSPGPFFGATGSFGMLDTPSQTLQDFSPMGPQYANNGEFNLDDSSALLPYNASNPAFLDLQDSPQANRRPKDGSPLAEFMTSPSPFDMKLHSTIMSSSKSPLVLQSVEKAAAVTHSNSNKRHHMDSSGKPEPRKLWPKEDGPPNSGSSSGGSRSSSGSGTGAVRLEIGGAGSLSTRNKMDSINTMVQSTPSRRSGGYGMHPPPPPPSHSHPGYHPSMPPHYGYRDDMNTPNKGHYRPAPPPRMYPPMPPSSAQKGRYSPHPGSTPKPDYLRDSKVPPPPPSYLRPSPPPPPNSNRKSPPPSAGKENLGGKKGTPGAGAKKSPCNCKRSKCLKLYCECFAAERYCDGCNCADCGNTPNAGPARDKAIKETRSKNANAFKEKFVKTTQTIGIGHNMGCRCKKSACLKKYCECFQAGALCGGKCKCVECMNYAGSQALIDKRRKIKDQRGADYAMRVADEAWKGKPPGVPLSARKGPPLPNSARKYPTPSPMGAPRLPPHMMHSTPRGPPHHPHHPHHYMGPPMMMGYPPMGMPMTPAGYHPHPGDPPHGMYPPPPGPPPSSAARKIGPKGMVTPASVPKSPPVRIKFDPATSRKKRNTKSGEPEPTLPFFGKTMPHQPKTTALAIFAFLSNDDIYNAGLVCKSWSRLAVDEELWKIQS